MHQTGIYSISAHSHNLVQTDIVMASMLKIHNDHQYRPFCHRYLIQNKLLAPVKS